jgi:hypothetical protein
MDDLIKALTILRKYGNPSWPTHCEHDVMYVNIRYSEVSDEDRGILNGLGFHEDDDNDGFMSYKFGSA